MKYWLSILILMLTLSAGAQNFMLRWTPLQWTNWVRQFSGSGTGSVAGLQWGSQNLTNLSTVGYGLTNLLKVHAVAPGTNITIQTNGGVWTVNAPPSPAVLTNVVWQRLTNYEQTLYIDIAFDGANNTAFWTNYNSLSNQWFSFTATSNTTLKLEMENVWRNEATNALESSDSVAFLWGSWETPNHAPVLFNFVENVPEQTIDISMVNTRAGPEYTYEADGVTFQTAQVRRSLPVTIRSGTTLRLYQGWELSREVGNPGATNYFVGSVWVQREQRVLMSP